MGDQGSEDRKLSRLANFKRVVGKHRKTSKWVYEGFSLPSNSKAFQKAGSVAERFSSVPPVNSSQASSQRSVILNARHKGYGHVIIAQAFAEGRYLVVQDANMNRFKFCADHHPALRSLTNQQLASFTIDPAGSGLHWADLDLDVDLDGLHAGAAHHEAPSSNPELDNHRLATARALELWLEQHPDIPRQLSGETGRHVSTILSGSADLRTSMIRELARQGSMDPHVVLEQLAELRHVTSRPGSP